MSEDSKPDLGSMARPTDESGRRPRYTKGDRTKTRVIDVAIDLFAKSGFRAVSLRDLAAAAGLSHAGLLHHFPGGKDEILGRILQRRDHDNVDRWEHTQRLSAADFSDVIAIVERNTHAPEYVALYAKLSNEATEADHPAHAYFVNRYEDLRDYLTKRLDRGLPVPHAIDPASAAQQLIALLDGLQTQWLLAPDQVDMVARTADFLRLLGLSVDPAQDQA